MSNEEFNEVMIEILEIRAYNRGYQQAIKDIEDRLFKEEDKEIDLWKRKT